MFSKALRGNTAALALLCASCSGDSSTSSAMPTPTPSPTPSVNTAPVFTSASAVSVLENKSLTYQATATSPVGRTITYTIAGGTDAGKFTLSPGGTLSFSAPDYELPSDANSDNVYEVQINANDGGQSSALNLQVAVSNDREGIAVRRVGSGFLQPFYVAPVPGDANRIFVVEKGGAVYFLTPSTGVKTLAFTATGLTTDGDQGLLSLAARPDFATSRIVFVQATGENGALEIREYDLSAGRMRLVLSTPHSESNRNYGGWLGFGPDGYLYAATGYGGSNPFTPQNFRDRLGKILRLRIDPNPDSVTPFGPAPGNPFGATGDFYVFARGLRNPTHASFDGNLLIIGDIGQTLYEEINIMQVDRPDSNFGWDYFEGTQATGRAPPPSAVFLDPVTQYTHGVGPRQGSAVVGGYVYRGPVAGLTGRYVFGDALTGNIWTVPFTSLSQGSQFPATQYERRNGDFTPDVGAIDSLISFGQDSAGNLYIVDFAGEIFMVKAN